MRELVKQAPCAAQHLATHRLALQVARALGDLRRHVDAEQYRQVRQDLLRVIREELPGNESQFRPGSQRGVVIMDASPAAQHLTEWPITRCLPRRRCLAFEPPDPKW